MGQSAVKNPRKIFSQPDTDVSGVNARVTALENHEFKVLYYEEINTASGAITKPVGSTIILDDFPSGIDAVVETIVNGKPSGYSPNTAGGVAVTVSSFDTSGNYTLSGTPSAFPVALLYVLRIKLVDWDNLDIDNIIEAQDYNKVTGPALGTDNAIAVYDGTTGKIIKDSVVSVTVDGAIVLPPRSKLAYLRGLLQYDSENESLSFYNNESEIFMQLGQELWMRCINTTGSTIANGQAVYVSGSSLGLPTIALAQANSVTTTVCAGLTTHSIENNTIGYVTVIGTVRNLDTSALSTGNVFLSDSVAGGLTNTAPTSPNYRYRMGFVTNVNATTGTIQVTPTTAALGNGTANQLLGINATGNQEFVNPPYDVCGHRRTSIVTYERWYTNAVNCAPGSTVALTNNASRYTPFIVVKKCTIDRLGIDISGAGSVGSVLKLGIYNSSNSMPSTLLLDAGTVNGNSATFQAITVNQVMDPGLYFMYVNHNSAANITVRTIGVSAAPIVLGYPNVGGTTPATSLFVAEAYNGTLPSPAPGVMSFGTGTPICHFIRLSA